MNFRAKLDVGDGYQQLDPEKLIGLDYKAKWYPAIYNNDGSYTIKFSGDKTLVVMHHEIKAMQVKSGSEWVDCSF